VDGRRVNEIEFTRALRAQQNEGDAAMRIVRSAIFLLVGGMTALGSTPLLAASEGALGAGLNQLVVAFERGDPSLNWKLSLHITDLKGDPMVLVHLAPGADADAALAKLAAAGFRLTTRSTINPALVEGYLPLGAARAAVAVEGVHSLHATHRPARHAGSVQSQAVALEKADIAQAKGFDGTGIKIGAISDSYDTCATCSTHAADDIKTGDLPAGGVTVLEDSPGGTDEGRAMLQLIHDIAPGSQLAFSTAFVGELDFAEQIIALRNKFGADVITDDVGYFDEPMYSDGILAQAIDIVAQSGAAYFSSAGNNGLEAYEAIYRPVSFAKAKALFDKGKSNVHLEQIPAAIRPQSVHNFRNADGSVSITQRFRTAASNIISFQWDEPFNLGLVKTDYNFYVFDLDGNWIDPATSPTVFYSTDNNLLTDQPFEIAQLIPVAGEIHGGANVTDYLIVIGSMNNGPARHIKYINDNGLGVSERQGAPSTYGHPSAVGAQAVAATYYAQPSFPEDFSSPGPVTMYFDTQGNRLREPEVRHVPQLTAADGVDTTFFGFDSDGSGFPNFFGTSAAAPDAAAVGALVLQAAGGPGSLSPRRLYDRLQDSATPIPVPNDRSIAAAEAGPVHLVMSNDDWVRSNSYFKLSVEDDARHFVKSITFDATKPGLNFSANPNRFSIGTTNSVQLTDITATPNGSVWSLQFAPGTFGRGDEFTFGMSVFSPIEGTTQEDPDRFRDMTITVVMDNGKKYTGKVFANEPEEQNVFTGSGLVNAARAIRN
jgi:hypothetical protein